MSKRDLETNNLAPANMEEQEITVSSREALAEDIMFALGLKRSDKATLWLYKDSGGDVHISRERREGVRMYAFTNRSE